MSDLIEQTKNNLRFWWTAWVELIVVLLLAGGSVWMGSTSNITSEQWTDMSYWDRHKLFLAVFLSMINALKAFLSNTMSLLKAKKEANGFHEPALTSTLETGKKP